MSQNTRIIIVVAVILLLAGAVALYGILGQKRLENASQDAPQEGMIHVYVDGKFVANVLPSDLNELPAASFKDIEEGKTQEGWWLRDVALLYVDEGKLSDSSEITVGGVRSTTGDVKSATITWAEANDLNNNVMFDLSGDGQAIKLASTLERLDVRDEWVQGVSRIDITTKP